MENLVTQPKEVMPKMSVTENGMTTHSPGIYRLAPEGVKVISDEHSAILIAPFSDDEIEIRPDGFLYIPAALIRGRYIKAVGPGGFAMVVIRNWEEPINGDQVKVYYDGGLYMNGYFVSRSIGEGMYSRKNPNSSSASGLESAKTDCFVRCSKDLGVGLQVFEPSFMRRWRKEKAVRVWVEEKRNGELKKTQLWRRIDVDPFVGETKGHSTTLNVPTASSKEDTVDRPWLNHGPDYEAVLQQLHDCKITINQLKDQWKISTKTMEAIKDVLTKEWTKYAAEKTTVKELTALYNDDINWIKEHDFIVKVFTDRREELQKIKA